MNLIFVEGLPDLRDDVDLRARRAARPIASATDTSWSNTRCTRWRSSSSRAGESDERHPLYEPCSSETSDVDVSAPDPNARTSARSTCSTTCSRLPGYRRTEDYLSDHEIALLNLARDLMERSCEVEVGEDDEPDDEP